MVCGADNIRTLGSLWNWSQLLECVPSAHYRCSTRRYFYPRPLQPHPNRLSFCSFVDTSFTQLVYEEAIDCPHGRWRMSSRGSWLETTKPTQGESLGPKSRSTLLYSGKFPKTDICSAPLWSGRDWKKAALSVNWETVGWLIHLESTSYQHLCFLIRWRIPESQISYPRFTLNLRCAKSGHNRHQSLQMTLSQNFLLVATLHPISRLALAGWRHMPGYQRPIL